MPGQAPDLASPWDAGASHLQVALPRQAAILLAGLPDSLSTGTPSLTPAGTVGRHVRHCVDFFEGFLDGLPVGCIDYVARRRDPASETGRAVAIARLATVERGLARRTVHRFALVAALSGTLDHPTDPGFGIAPSTVDRWSRVGRPTHVG